MVLVVGFCEIGSYDSLADRLKEFRQLLAGHLEPLSGEEHDGHCYSGSEEGEAKATYGVVRENGSQGWSANGHHPFKGQMSPWAGVWMPW